MGAQREGGRPSSVFVCDTSEPHPLPSRVWRDSGFGAMLLTVPKFFLCMLPFHQTIHVLSAKQATRQNLICICCFQTSRLYCSGRHIFFICRGTYNLEFPIWVGYGCDVFINTSKTPR